ncbi:hypothetical protein [Acinetobacter sp. WZC-1]|uniref:hypothetical protein n=1 Tax=Acinetobacter sp. WZC-1 TaxID=3459034 RepID=UPI00403DCD3E
MKISTPIRTNIYTHQNLAAPENFFRRIKFRCENYPELVPEKCGFWEPFEIKFSPDIIETLIPDDRGGQADSLYWSKAKKTKAWGAFSVPIHGNMHANEVIHSELQQTDQHKLTEYVKKVCLEFNADLAIIDIEVNDSWNLANPHIGGVEPTTDQLRHWLPDMYWGVVFGKPYIDLWGESLLLGVPAFKVEKLSDELIFIQLTESISDVVEKTEEIRIKREEIKKFLNSYVFYTPEKGYKGSDTLWFFSGRSENDLIRIPRVEYSTKVFNTPHFTIENSEQYAESDVMQNESEKLSQLRLIDTDMWKVALSKEWLIQAYPEQKADLSTGTVEEIRFFYTPDGYDSPIEKELFIGAWDRPDQEKESRQDYAESSIQELIESYPPAVSEWQTVESEIKHFQAYSEVYLDQTDQQEFNLFRIAIKLIIFDSYFVKLTFMDYWCNDLSESKEISDPVFCSFQAK